MLLELKAKHFKGTHFIDEKGCALERAVKEEFNTINVSECVSSFYLNGHNYSHIRYELKDFRKDKEKAKKLRYSNAVVRRIRIKGLNKN